MKITAKIDNGPKMTYLVHKANGHRLHPARPPVTNQELIVKDAVARDAEWIRVVVERVVLPSSNMVGGSPLYMLALDHAADAMRCDAAGATLETSAGDMDFSTTGQLSDASIAITTSAFIDDVGIVDPPVYASITGVLA